MTTMTRVPQNDPEHLDRVEITPKGRKPRTLKLTVNNVGFLLDRLGEDCAPLQFLRELTQNGIEAGAKRITWDLDAGHPKPKLTIIDDGCGMTGPEMVGFINQLASTGKTLGTEANFGVGAKIAAATRNHAGLLYLSWKDGEGAMIHLWRDPSTGQYGLRQLARPDGTFDVWAPVSDEVKPQIIKEHGTKVVLLGNSLGEDTMRAPKDAASPSTWIAKYLNSRYYQLPETLTIKARQGWTSDKPENNLLRQVTGQKVYLDKHATQSGELELTGATARWWILNDSPALSSNSGLIESAGHVAALYKDELYDMVGGRQGLAKLQQFGILFGARQIVIYVEPHTDGEEKLSSNTARTDLLLGRKPLPWSDWASEFRGFMPDEIAEFMEEIASKNDQKDHGETIRERLKSLLTIFEVGRYKPLDGGNLRIEPPEDGAGGMSLPSSAEAVETDAGAGDASNAEADADGGAVGGIYSTAIREEGGKKGERAKRDPFPAVQWITVENGSRETGDLEDKAARYLEDQNTLLINGDFRIFKDMEDHWVSEYEREHGRVPGLKQIVRDLVHQWYEQSLVEAIIGLQGLRGSREWTIIDLQDAWSDAALTTVVMQRYHPYNAVKRDLAIRISSLKPSKREKAG